jgi:hypothetical protein
MKNDYEILLSAMKSDFMVRDIESVELLKRENENWEWKVKTRGKTNGNIAS